MSALQLVELTHPRMLRSPTFDMQYPRIRSRLRPMQAMATVVVAAELWRYCTTTRWS
jgi:hypothetical protein